MKPKTFTIGRLLFALMIIGTTLSLVSWDFKQSSGHYRQSAMDTTPKTKKTEGEKNILDLDDVLDELNTAELQVNMEKVQKELAEAMKKFDMEKAMKEVDFEKIKKEVDQSMAKIDMKKIQAEMTEAMKEIDAAKIQQEAQASMQKIDWDKMKAEMDKVKKIDMSKMQAEMQKVQEEMKELGPKLEKEMEKTKIEMEKAKKEMKEYKEFVDGLQADGLINKKEGYTITHKNGELIVNGKKVSEQVYSKYRSFLEKHKKFNIEKSNDDFNIHID
jgi:hypothetical protein